MWCLVWAETGTMEIRNFRVNELMHFCRPVIRIDIRVANLCQLSTSNSLRLFFVRYSFRVSSLPKSSKASPFITRTEDPYIKINSRETLESHDHLTVNSWIFILDLNISRWMSHCLRFLRGRFAAADATHTHIYHHWSYSCNGYLCNLILRWHELRCNKSNIANDLRRQTKSHDGFNDLVKLCAF